MTGCMLVASDFCLVITEGSLKSQKKYNRLMLNRIDWNQGQDDEQQGIATLPVQCSVHCSIVTRGCSYLCCCHEVDCTHITRTVASCVESPRLLDVMLVVGSPLVY